MRAKCTIRHMIARIILAVSGPGLRACDDAPDQREVPTPPAGRLRSAAIHTRTTHAKLTVSSVEPGWSDRWLEIQCHVAAAVLSMNAGLRTSILG